MANSSLTDTSPLTRELIQLISHDVFSYISPTVAITTACVVLFGIISNLINITIFSKMGPNTSANICFLALSVCDLVNNLYISVAAMNKMPFIPQERMFLSLQYLLVVTLPVFYVSYTTGAWVTTIINMERSCAVVFPMKVKNIFTKKTVTAMILSMVVYVIVADTPYLMTQRLILVETQNRSRLVLDRSRRNQQMVTLGSTLAFTVPTWICTIIVVFGTAFLITSYEKSRELRKKMTGKNGENIKSKISSKDARVVKSVILICGIYIVGFSIGAGMPLLRKAYPRLRNDDPIFGNFSSLMSGLTYLLQGLSCSVNILIYLAMNYNYKTTFKSIFGMKQAT